MEERRRATRLGAWLNAVYTVPGSAGKPASGLVRTTSEGGISLLTGQSLTPGVVAQVTVSCLGRPPIAFTAEVRWCQPLKLPGDSQPPRAHEVGMQFRDITPDDRKAILLYTVLSPPAPMG